MEKTRQIIERSGKYVSFFNGIAVLAVIFINVINILTRYLFSKPIQGAVEITCLLTLVFISIGLFVSAYEEGHVKVDFFVQKFSERARRITEIVTCSASFVFFLSVTLKMIPYIQAQSLTGETTQDLHIPKFLPISAIWIGLVLFTIATLYVLISYIKKGGK